jgi:hypothetical protein
MHNIRTCLLTYSSYWSSIPKNVLLLRMSSGILGLSSTARAAACKSVADPAPSARRIKHSMTFTMALEGESSPCVTCMKANRRFRSHSSCGPVNELLHHLELLGGADRTHLAAFAYCYAACLIMRQCTNFKFIILDQSPCAE